MGYAVSRGLVPGLLYESILSLSSLVCCSDTDVSTEELDALVEKARPALDEAEYQKLKAAVRTLSVVTAMLENRETTLQSLRNLLCQSQTEKTASLSKRAGVPTDKPPAAPNPKRRDMAVIRQSLSWSAQGPGFPCLLKSWRPMSGVSARQSLRST